METENLAFSPSLGIKGSFVTVIIDPSSKLERVVPWEASTEFDKGIEIYSCHITSTSLC
jgi:hypothetical protein